MSDDINRFAREALESEIKSRHEKLWKIFSWAATLLVGIIAGIIALKTDEPRAKALTCELKMAILIAVVILTSYSCLWISQNISIWDEAKTKQRYYDRILGVKSVPKRPAPFGYTWALIMLAAGAILALFIK